MRDGLHTGPLEANDEGHRQRYADPQVRAHVAAMRAQPEPSVPCMNELLTENFIDVKGLLLLIDADDSANRKPSDELGNISGVRRTLRSFIRKDSLLRITAGRCRTRWRAPASGA